jgi:hypothetical protein
MLSGSGRRGERAWILLRPWFARAYVILTESEQRRMFSSCSQEIPAYSQKIQAGQRLHSQRIPDDRARCSQAAGDTFSSVYSYLRKLSLENFLRMESEYPDVARQFHNFVVKLLAARLAAASEAIEALL